MKRLKLWLASILKKLAFRLSGQNRANKNGKSTHKQKESNPEARHTAPVTRTIVQIPDSVLQEYRTTQNQQEAENRKTRHISLGAVCTAAAIALIGIWQASLTRTQLNLSERPWVSLDLSTSTLAIKNGTLTFNSKGGCITIIGEMMNKGNSVAMHTLAYFKIKDTSQLPSTEMQTAQLCKSPRNPVGYNLFPSDRISINYDAHFYPNDITYGTTHRVTKGWVEPIAVVCIQYQSVFGKYHLTQYVFHLRTSKGIGVFEPKGVVGDLHLAHDVPFGDWAY